MALAYSWVIANLEASQALGEMSSFQALVSNPET